MQHWNAVFWKTTNKKNRQKWNMDDYNQKPDLNFFYESVSHSFDTDYVSWKYLKSKFKNYTNWESLNIKNEYKSIIYQPLSKTNVYQPLDSDIDVCENYLRNIFFKDNVLSKNILLAGNFNIKNLIHFQQNKKDSKFYYFDILIWVDTKNK